MQVVVVYGFVATIKSKRRGGIRSKPPPVSLENRLFFNINPYFVGVLKTRGTWLVVGELAPLFG